MAKNQTLTSEFNKPVTANTDILTAYLTPVKLPSVLAIYATFDVAGFIKVRRKMAGTTITENLNNGQNLNANSAQIFDVFVDTGESINLQFSATGTALSLKLVEEDTD